MLIYPDIGIQLEANVPQNIFAFLGCFFVTFYNPSE